MELLWPLALWRLGFSAFHDVTAPSHLWQPEDQAWTRDSHVARFMRTRVACPSAKGIAVGMGMDMHWKHIGERANPRRWSGFVWSVVAFVLLCSLGTAFVGVKLYQVTNQEVGFNTR